MRSFLWVAISVALISLAFMACEKEEEKKPIQTYMVQVTATEGGTVEGKNGEYQYGDTVVFTAIPSDGYYFSQWSDGKTENPRMVLVFADKSFEAQFSQYPLVTVIAGNDGTVSGSENGRYAPGTSLSYTATPSDGCYFIRWSDGRTNNPRTINVGTKDISLTAEFVGVVVDLGLESGNLWATCNVGAVNPWYYGDYYAWGEVQTQFDYSWETYKYCQGSDKSLTKYNYDVDYGTVDNKTVLEPIDDVATAVLGADYSMPTKADWEELGSQCYWVWTDKYNEQRVSGCIVYKAKKDEDKGIKVIKNDAPSASYSLSDAHIFLPAAGYCYNSEFDRVDDYGVYWSSSLCEKNYPCDAQRCQFRNGDVSTSSYTGYRCSGYSVRPVCHKK